MPHTKCPSRDLQPVFVRFATQQERQLRLFVRLSRSMRCPLGSPPQGTLIEIPLILNRPTRRQNFQKTDSTRAALIAMFYQTSLPVCSRPTSTGREKKKKEREGGRKKERERKKRKKCGSPDRLVMNLWMGLSDEKQKEVSRMNLLEEESAILEKVASGALGRNATSRRLSSRTDSRWQKNCVDETISRLVVIIFLSKDEIIKERLRGTSGPSVFQRGPLRSALHVFPQCPSARTLFLQGFRKVSKWPLALRLVFLNKKLAHIYQ